MENHDTLEKLFTPWVMRAAWWRVEDWYRTSGDLYDIAEYLEWQTDPWSHLNRLKNDLVQDRYRPAPFPLVPYPKKNNIRHYCMPTVRDQVAFMTYIVLLGPFLEARMYNVSFGNRLFRPRVLRDGDNSGRKRWFRAPFSLSEGRLFDRFPASYGLFRQSLQSIVNKTVFSSDAESGSDKHPNIIDDDIHLEDPDLLPYDTDHPLGKASDEISFARLDLSKAYPSVPRQSLFADLEAMVQETAQEEGWGKPLFPELNLPKEILQQRRPWGSTIEPQRELGGQHPWHTLTSSSSLRV